MNYGRVYNSFNEMCAGNPSFADLSDGNLDEEIERTEKILADLKAERYARFKAQSQEMGGNLPELKSPMENVIDDIGALESQIVII